MKVCIKCDKLKYYDIVSKIMLANETEWMELSSMQWKYIEGTCSVNNRIPVGGVWIESLHLSVNIVLLLRNPVSCTASNINLVPEVSLKMKNDLFSPSLMYLMLKMDPK